MLENSSNRTERVVDALGDANDQTLYAMATATKVESEGGKRRIARKRKSEGERESGSGSESVRAVEEQTLFAMVSATLVGEGAPAGVGSILGRLLLAQHGGVTTHQSPNS